MNGQALEKIDGGKLLILKVKYDEKIRKVEILGDFFAHPEETIGILESELTGVRINFDPSLMVEKLQGILDESEAEIIGFEMEDLIRVLQRALS